MNAVKNLARFQAAVRQFNTTSVRPKRTHAEFKELQRQLQVDDGVPVYIKKGPVDKMLVRTIMLSVACLLGYSAVFLKRMIYPPPPS